MSLRILQEEVEELVHRVLVWSVQNGRPPAGSVKALLPRHLNWLSCPGGKTEGPPGPYMSEVDLAGSKHLLALIPGFPPHGNVRLQLVKFPKGSIKIQRKQLGWFDAVSQQSTSEHFRCNVGACR